MYLKPAIVRKVSRDSEEDVQGYEVYETRDLGAEEIKKILSIVVEIQPLTLRNPCAFRLKIFTP